MVTITEMITETLGGKMKKLFLLLFLSSFILGQASDPPAGYTQKFGDNNRLKLYNQGDRPSSDSLNDDKNIIADTFRKQLYEFQINQINVINGILIVASGAKVNRVLTNNLPTSASIQFQDVSEKNLTPFAVNDVIMCTRVNSDASYNVRWVGIVTSVVGLNVSITKDLTAPATVGVPSHNDIFARIGNTSDLTRQASITLLSEEINLSDPPKIIFKDNVTSYSDWTNTNKTFAVIGSIKGQYGFLSDVAGVGLGYYDVGRTNITIDPDSGMMFNDYQTNFGKINGSEIRLGKLANSTHRAEFTDSDLSFIYRNSSGVDNTWTKLSTAGLELGVDENSNARFLMNGQAIKGIYKTSLGVDETWTDLSISGLELGVDKNTNSRFLLDGQAIKGIYKTSLGIDETLLDLSISGITTGLKNSENINISSSGVLFRDNGTVYGSFSGTEWNLGLLSSARANVTPSAIKLYDNAGLLRTQVDATGVRLGRLGEDYLYVTPSGLNFYNSSAQSTGLMTGTSWRMGLDASNQSAVRINSGAITLGTSTISAFSVDANGNGSFAGDLSVDGLMTIGSTGHIKGGQTDYETGTGFWLGNDAGTYKFSIGNSSDYLKWNGSLLNVNGTFSGIVSGVENGSEISIQGWTQTITFTSTDYNTVSWSSGTIDLLDGSSYSVSSGNTGNMSGVPDVVTYVYFETSTPTVLKTTTVNTDAVGTGKILLAVCRAVSSADDLFYTDKEALFTVYGGRNDGTNSIILANNIGTNTLTANEIAANTITSNEIKANTLTANEIASNTITANELNVSQLSAITADLGSVTAGSITGGTITGGTITGGAISGGTIDGSTITGGTVQTSSSGARVVLGSTYNDIKFYNSNGDLGGFIQGDIYSTSPTIKIAATLDVAGSQLWRSGHNITVQTATLNYNTINYGIDANSTLGYMDFGLDVRGNTFGYGGTGGSYYTGTHAFARQGTVTNTTILNAQSLEIDSYTLNDDGSNYLDVQSGYSGAGIRLANSSGAALGRLYGNTTNFGFVTSAGAWNYKTSLTNHEWLVNNTSYMDLTSTKLNVKNEIQENSIDVCRWRGSSTTEPTIDVQNGDIYHNTSLGKVFIRASSGWILLN